MLPGWMSHLQAQDINDGTPYRMVSRDHKCGSIGIGTYHNSEVLMPYISDDNDMTTDCYWLFEKVADDQWRIKNALTGQYIKYTGKKESGVYEGAILVDDDNDDDVVWYMTSLSGYLQFYHLTSSEKKVFIYISASGITKSSAGKDNSKSACFYLQDEDGSIISDGEMASDADDDHGGGSDQKEDETDTKVTKYVSDIKISNRKPAYNKTDSYYLCVLPQEEEGLVLSYVSADEQYSLELRDGSDAVTDVKKIKMSYKYALAVVDGEGSVVASEPVIFTTLPVLDITYTGSLTRDMDEYIWGTMSLSSTEKQRTVELTAKYKTRGATASEYLSKPALNMKLRKTLTDGSVAEIDTTLLGMRKASSWILDAMAIDRICMRNRVSFDVWNEIAPLPYETAFDSRNGTVGQFVEVIMNGAYKGIYCLTDKINRSLLELKKPVVDETTGEVTIRGAQYKHGTNHGDQSTPGFFDDYMMWVAAYHDAWELKEPEDYPSEAAWAPLQTVYDNYQSYTWVKDNFFIDQLATYQVFIIGLCVVDNWGKKNSIVSIRNQYAEGDKKKFIYTPWDLDTALGGSYNGSFYNGTYTEWSVSDAMKGSQKPVPFIGLDGNSDYRAEMKKAWVAARDGGMSMTFIRKKMEKYRNQFLSSGAWERQKAHPNGSKLCDDLTQEIEYILDWYEDRLQEMNTYFGISAADGIDDVTVSGQTDERVYDLQGRRTENPGKGIYIKNGKKYIKVYSK